jgi:hypothetical protein
MRATATALLIVLLAIVCVAQATLTNEAILKMSKAGLSEEIILGTIKAQPGQYSTGPDDLIALKSAGVSDKIIAGMLEKSAVGGGAKPAAAPAAPVAPAVAGPINEVGVYYKKAGAWTELPPEVVNFKTGGVLKTIGTAGVVKGDVNGNIQGEHSRTSVTQPVELLVYAPEGVNIAEYQLLRLRAQKNTREFRTMTGGVFHASGGATRDLVPFDGKKTAPRTYEIVLPSLGAGEFGLLPPTTGDATGTSGRLGKIYSFRILE